jgi:hypothetical protein
VEAQQQPHDACLPTSPAANDNDRYRLISHAEVERDLDEALRPHLDGDADGLGAVRGLRVAVCIYVTIASLTLVAVAAWKALH